MRGATGLLLLLRSPTFLFAPRRAVVAVAAEKVIIHEIREAHKQSHARQHELASPFLSATLKTRIAPVAAAIDALQVGLLSAALVSFYQKVFEDQEVYDVEIVGVGIFEESLDSMTNDEGRQRRELVEDGGKRILALNELQNTQFHFQHDLGDEGESKEEDSSEDYYYQGDSTVDDIFDKENGDDMFRDATDAIVDAEHGSERKDASGRGGDGGYALTFATVVSAEHTAQQFLSHADFQDMLVHVSRKFDGHLTEYVREINDGYFAGVASVTVSGFEQEAAQTPGPMAEDVREPYGFSAGSAAWIVISCVLALVTTAFVIGLVKICRKDRQRPKQWRAQEIALSNNAPPKSSIKALRVLYSQPRDDDDYSFEPHYTNNVYTKGTTRFEYDTDNGCPGEQSPQEVPFSMPKEETITFDPTSYLFTQSPSVVASTERPGRPQHVFAPPGKVGIAIDIADGQPVVHRVKEGSPLEGLLRPGDRVLAIDAVDTTRLSAADVTRLMAKRMKYSRRITFARGAFEGSP